MPVGITLLGESCRKMNFVVVVVPVVACRVLWSRKKIQVVEKTAHTNAKLYVCMLGSPESLPEGAGVQWVQAGTHQRDNPRTGLKGSSPSNQRMEVPLTRTD